MEVDKNMNELLLGASLVLLVVGAYRYYNNIYSYWPKRGLKGPIPLPVIGNLHMQILCDRPKLERDWREKYGKVYGSFMTSGPRMIIADPEVLRQISTKDFDVFPNHYMNNLMNKFSKASIFFLKDEHWKRVRVLLSPTFTSGKIKRMFRLLDRCADDLVELFGEQLRASKRAAQGEGVLNVKDLYNLFTMDAITTCCYGLKLERAGSADLQTAAVRNDFVRLALRFFELSVARIIVATLTPRPILRALGFNINPESSVLPLVRRVEQLIKGRQASAQKFNDYLQLLLDAKLEDRLELDEADSQENHHAGLTHESLQADQSRMAGEARERLDRLEAAERNDCDRGKEILSAHEIVSNAVFLLFVGLETTSTLLTNCCYALAFHPAIQERLYGELEQIAEYNEDKTTLTFDYDKLTACRYLDSVISETLRLLSPVLQIDREAVQDYRIEKYNVCVKKGSILALAFHAIHTDPDYWPEPSKFDPNRFMPDNRDKIVPGSYCPFGMGPRHCLGMRFSLTEAKLSLAKIMMNYRFEPAPNTVFPPPCKATFVLYNTKTPIVRISKRTLDRRNSS